MGNKIRLDVLLTSRGLCESREKAKALILAGEVTVGGDSRCRPSDMLPPDADVAVKSKPRFVSRGGLKLEKALDAFGISLTGVTALDIGASTGGFTDCMLQRGAARVYAVDVGYGQLDYRLRTDPRVVCMERTNIRHVKPDSLPEKAGFFTVDVSFISLKLVLPAVKPLLEGGAQGVCLVKPQFEAGREKVGKKGVVREFCVHHDVLCDIISFTQGLFDVRGVDFSPIRGPEGNIEYLMHVSDGGGRADIDAQAVVRASHDAFGL